MDGAIFRTNGFIKHETKRTVQPESFHDYVKDVVEGARHPMQDADEQWKSDWEAKGKRVRLSNDPIDRSEERSAAIVANVWTQASVEPLVDHGEHNRNVRDQSIDFILGRSRRAERRKMPRETRKQLDKLEI